MNVPVEEQETVVNYSRSGQYAEVYTSDSTVMTKLDRRVKQSSDWELIKTERFQDGSIAAKVYRCPKKLVSFRGSMSTRVMTDEQKQQAAERLKLLRNKNNETKEGE